jgi:hypothetical protein
MTPRKCISAVDILLRNNLYIAGKTITKIFILFCPQVHEMSTFGAKISLPVFRGHFTLSDFRYTSSNFRIMDSGHLDFLNQTSCVVRLKENRWKDGDCCAQGLYYVGFEFLTVRSTKLAAF